MDAWTHQAGFPLVTLRFADGGGGNGSDQLRLVAAQVGTVCTRPAGPQTRGRPRAEHCLLTLAALVFSRIMQAPQHASAVLRHHAVEVLRLPQCRLDSPYRHRHSVYAQEPFAAGQPLQCGSAVGSRRGPWWLPLAYVSGGGSGGGPPADVAWTELDSCNSGAIAQSLSQNLSCLSQDMYPAVCRRLCHKSNDLPTVTPTCIPRTQVEAAFCGSIATEGGKKS